MKKREKYSEDGKIEFNVKLGNFIEKIKKKINEKEL